MGKKYSRWITIFVIIFLIPSWALASELILKSGEKLEGKIVEQTDKYVKFDSGVGVVMTYYSDEIDTIDGKKLKDLVTSTSVVVPAGQTQSDNISESINQVKSPAESILKPCVTGLSAEQCEFSRLYDCSRKLYPVAKNGQCSGMEDCKNILPYQVIFIDKDFFLILEKNKPALYFFTPYFAGEANLSHDKEVNKIWKDVVKLPLPSDDPAKAKGYYYMTLYYEPGGYLAIDDYLPFNPDDDQHAQVDPFLKERMSSLLAKNESLASTEQFFSLGIEDKLWDKNVQNNFSPDAKRVLIEDIALKIKTMPPEKKEGDIFVICPGMGCYRTISWQEATDFNKKRSDALQYSKAVADEYNLYGSILAKEDIDSKLKKSNQPEASRIEIDKIDPGYTRDDNHVYYYGKIVEGADPKSFHRIGRTYYFKDVKHVYLGNKVLTDADVLTFSPLDPENFSNYLARDANHVFYEASEVPGANPQNVKIVGGQYWSSNQTMFVGNKPIGDQLVTPSRQMELI